ncbi:Gamma-glutamyl:cysteine ligase YbdK, ATP-grasp superfamily [Haladaptatus litoreus]|uniref:Gamma-glutamyl:cysteine ligase YbdK, ATP-grasp superfamily n=1 Tax=Haladaptatus litoreus TaxID=553468 RepID=A0A1N7DWM9_9EURY|nr:glutamate-cysteine ligase family protein [Haladaptatus litoreus]SIR80247.1 Gamma-glutamyl:cysteine ligase YbdK, ATP-grasp superfamily [Haladaptatus litoreus]
MKIGVEAEYWIIDESGELATETGGLLDELFDVSEYVVPEFVAPLIEVQTPPVSGAEELRREFGRTLRTVCDVAENRGLSLVPLGTPLTRESLEITSKRGRLLESMYGDDMEYAMNCAGTHVHFDRGNVVRQLNLLTALDPALALVCSSPYISGNRVACSSRAAVYRYESHTTFARYRDLWDYVETEDQWEARIDEQYHTLQVLARERGIDPETFGNYFHRDDTVLTPVRLRHKSPTVEWRAPDTAFPSQIVRLVSEITNLLQQTEYKEVTIGETGVRTEEIGIPPYAELRELSEEAIKEGIASLRVQDYLTTMGFDVSRYHPISQRIENGWTLPREEALRLRREYADEFEKDVEALLGNA